MKTPIRSLSLIFGLTAGLGFGNVAVAGKTPTLEQMWQMLQAQQKEIQRLKRRNKQLERQLDATTNKVSSAIRRAPAAHQGHHANTQPASTRPISSMGKKAMFSGRKTTVGGYGELHYNNLDSKKEIDFHRFVLFYGHQFNSRTRFFSELELEHTKAGDGDPGVVQLEQAYIEYDLNDKHRLQMGILLVPVGFLNPTHEPDTFYGVERNPVEKYIIPTTWWEAGAGLSGQIGDKGWSYDAAIHSGLKLSAAKAYGVRKGRQKVAEAMANDLAFSGRIRWTGMPGVEIGATFYYQGDMSQGTDANVGAGRLLEAHLAVQRGRFGLRALYAQWNIDGSGPAANGADVQKGWYVEPSWKITPKLGVFYRYNEWDNTAGSSASQKKKQTNVGLNYWLHDNVVVKFDIQKQGGAINDDGFSLGVGYQF